MKNHLIILLIAVFTFSCETAPKEVELGPPPGYLATADGKIDARDANPANLGIWEKYIDAHNNRDYETIASMNHDSIVLNLADGTDVIGNDNHIQTLKAYMDASNPKWDIFFSYTMNVEGIGGEPGIVDVIDIESQTLIDNVEIGKQAGGIAFWKMEI